MFVHFSKNKKILCLQDDVCSSCWRSLSSSSGWSKVVGTICLWTLVLFLLQTRDEAFCPPLFLLASFVHQYQAKCLCSYTSYTSYWKQEIFRAALQYLLMLTLDKTKETCISIQLTFKNSTNRLIDVINLLVSSSLCCILPSSCMDYLWHPSGPKTLTVNAMLPSYLNSRASASVMPWNAINCDQPAAKNMSDWFISSSIWQTFPRGPETLVMRLFRCSLWMQCCTNLEGISCNST